MTDVSPLCHTPCIIWFGKQHTVFCSISMSQTVCKQLVITQFSENHYFPMKCWSRSKLCFGMASAPVMRSAGCCRYAGAHGEPGTNKAHCRCGEGRGEGVKRQKNPKKNPANDTKNNCDSLSKRSRERGDIIYCLILNKQSKDTCCARRIIIMWSIRYYILSASLVAIAAACDSTKRRRVVIDRRTFLGGI